MSDPSEANGKASIREVYAIAQRIEDKIDEQIARHDKRIGSLERWRATIVGGAILATTTLTIIIRLIGGKL